ncbi:MAG: LapA family protein [Roseibium sp.]|nr:LapA family protein [Roseibium sp.]
MTRFVKNIILLAVAVFLVPLSVANRHTVSLSLNPFDPQDPRLTIADIPLFWVIFASLAVGIVLGGIGAWAKQGKWRKEARTKRREADRWHREADQLRERSEDALDGMDPNRPRLTGPGDRRAA